MSLSSSFIFHFMDKYESSPPQRNVVHTKSGPLLLGDLTAQNLQLLGNIKIQTPSKVALEPAAPLSARLMTPRSAASAPIAILSPQDADLELADALEAKNAQMRALIRSNSSRDGASAGSTDAPDEDRFEEEEDHRSCLDSSFFEEEDKNNNIHGDDLHFYDHDHESFAVFADVDSEEEEDEIFRMDL